MNVPRAVGVDDSSRSQVRQVAAFISASWMMLRKQAKLRREAAVNETSEFIDSQRYL